MKVTEVDLTDFIPDQDNANQGSPRGQKMIEESLQEDGAARSVVVDEAGRVVAGNKTLEAAVSIGLQKAILVETDGTELVVVKRKNWDLEDNQGSARRYAYRDNRTSEVSLQWDPAQLLLDKEAGVDFSGLFYENELDEITADVEKEEPPEESPPADKAAELQEKWQTQLGQIWQLGRHKIACIDSTDEEAIKTLIGKDVVGMIWADPPYGMKLDTDWSSAKSALRMLDGKGILGGRKYAPIKGDDFDFDPNNIPFLSKVKEVFLWGADYYAERLPDKNNGSWMVWDKRLDESADRMYGSCFELCWSKQKHKREVIRIKWAGVFGIEQEPDKRRYHPTQKPVALFEWVANKHFNEGGVVFDPFLGSGMSVIGAENIGDRITVIGCELAPEYIAVVIQRWVDLTGLDPVLVESIKA